MSKNSDRCPETTESGGYHVTRLLRCQRGRGHDGQCSYHRKGGQGGTYSRWWGANPRPITWIGDLGHAALCGEIYRLRSLCDEHSIDWQADVILPGWARP